VRRERLRVTSRVAFADSVHQYPHDPASQKRALPVQSRGTQLDNRVLEELKPCRPHLALGEVTTRGLGITGNRFRRPAE
jgi:hypothetical protein